MFAVNTDDKYDLAYLEELLRSHPKYSKHVAKKEYQMWVGSWEAVSAPENVYVKIDDDVVSAILVPLPYLGVQHV